MDTTTETVRAVVSRAPLPISDPDSLVDAEVPRPEAGSHDLLVDVRAVSVNPVDVKVRASREPEAGGVSVVGFDAAGVVVAVGADASRYAVGDEVFYAGSIARPGTNSELHAVDERIVGRKPSSLSFAEAAALPLTAITAWEGLFDKLRITRESEGVLLVAGATGGVGSMVLQLIETLVPGVRTIATSSRPEGDSWVRDLGADVVVDHRGDLRAQLADAAPDGIDWVFTSVVEQEGALALYADVLRPFGAILAIDDPESLDVVPLKTKALSLHWEFMFARPLAGGDDQLRQGELLDEVADLVDAGRLRTTMTTALSPIDAEQLREAHRLVEDGHVIGKVVLSRD